MFTMRLDLSLCGMWYCEALVLLVGVLLCRVLTLPWVYCVICTMYAAACSIHVVVYSVLLYVATVFDYIPFPSVCIKFRFYLRHYVSAHGLLLCFSV